MANADAPKATWVNVGGIWKHVDGNDAGASQINVAGTWRNLTEMHVNVGGTWYQVFKSTDPAAPTLASRAFNASGFSYSWTNPSGVWAYEIKRRLQSAADIDANYFTIQALTTTIATSDTDTTVAYGTRYVYRIRVYDFFGHFADLQIDTLRGRVASPSVWNPTDSATFRGTAFRTDVGNSAYQGFTSTGMNYGHYWYGGNIYNTFGGVLLPTVSAITIVTHRLAGGDGGNSKATFWQHNQTIRGTANGWSNNGTNKQLGVQATNSSFAQGLDVAHADAFLNNTYKGAVFYDSDVTLQSYGTSRQYMQLGAYNSTDLGGRISITHST